MLELKGIVKSFGGVHALKGVDFSVAPGEIVGLVGGNGAGKSTLMKVASGIHIPDKGTVSIHGQTPQSPAEAIALGVSLVRQELIQANELDIGANVMLGHEPRKFGLINFKELYRQAQAAIDQVGGGLDVRATLKSFSPAAKQRVEIARALSLNAKILLLDEPTATLTEKDSAVLFELLRNLKAKGLGMVYISHRLKEVMEITDRVVCVRDGKRVADLPTKEATQEKLVELLAGEAVLRHDEPPPCTDEVVLSVKGRVNFDLHAGEILGLAGLVGAGRTSVMRELFGVSPQGLEITLRGKALHLKEPRDAIAAGLALVPEERASQGLILSMLVERNIALPSLKRFLLEDEAAIAKPFMESFGIRGGGPASMLSGGNQQKIVLAKWMLLSPQVLLLDEPTRGLDVKAKRDVYDVARRLASEGKGVLVSSSEADELAELCHRTLVLKQGRSVGELSRAEISDANILRLGA